MICSLIGLYVFTNIGRTTTEIVSHSMPATVNSLRLAEETSGSFASVPRLMAAQESSTARAVAEEIAQQNP